MWALFLCLIFDSQKYKIIMTVKSEVKMMTAKMGRPTDNPKIEKITIRLDNECSAILDKYCKENGTSRAEAIRQGIKRLSIK